MRLYDRVVVGKIPAKVLIMNLSLFQDPTLSPDTNTFGTVYDPCWMWKRV